MVDSRAAAQTVRLDLRRSVRVRAMLASVTAVVAAFVSLPAVAPAETTYSHVGEFGGSGTTAGLFRQNPAPQRITVHEASGKVFVADTGNNRVQVFSPTPTGATYSFEIPTPRPVGLAVDQDSGALYVSRTAGAAINEIQTIRIENATSGTYTLSFAGETTVPIAFNATAAQVQAALRALPTIGDPNVTVTGAAGSDALRTRAVTFVGALTGIDVDAISFDASALNPQASISVDSTPGFPALPLGIDKFNPDVVSNPAAYARDGGFESPPAGAGAGELGGVRVGAVDRPGGGGLAVDPHTGDLLVADTGKNIIQRYDSGGWDGGAGFEGAFNGASVSPPRGAFTGLRDIATTSTGDIVVADVAGNQARVDRFDGTGALQATLSQANNPVINNALSDSGIVVAVNSATDEVFVSSEPTAVILLDVPNRIYQFENDVLVRDFGVASTRMHGFIFGMAARGSSPGRLYALATPSHFSDGTARVQAFNAQVPPSVAIEAPESVTPTDATFVGTVNPRGSAATWYFEYRRVGIDAGWPGRTSGVTTASVDVDIPVQATVGDLDPSTEYEVRLVADAGGGVVTVSDPVAFDSGAARPSLSAAAATFVTDRAAVLVAGINPHSLPTTYRFEYGLDSDYGQVVPAGTEFGDAGDGRTRISVSEPVENLEPSTTYHFRVVAENGVGVSEGPDGTFTTQADVPGVGSARSYELVSVVPTGGIHMFRVHAESDDGDRVLYQADIEGPHVPGFEHPHRWFLAQRGTDRWHNDPVDYFHPRTLDVVAPASVTGPADLSRLAIEMAASADADDQNHSDDFTTANPNLAPGKDVYSYDNGVYSWMTRDPRLGAGFPQTNPARVGIPGQPLMASMSDDGNAMAFVSQRQLLDGDTTVGSAARLYKRTASGLSFIGTRPDGSVPATGSSLGSSSLGVDYSPNAVSDDGASVVWSARRHDASPGSISLYLQSDGKPTVEVSRENGVPPLSSPHPFSVRYWGAATDTSRVFFTSSSRLTPDSGASHSSDVTAHSDLYVYDRDSDTITDLTPRLDGVVDASAPIADPAARARVRGVTAVADDGSRVYFVADGALDAEPSPFGEFPSSVGRNLYMVQLGAGGEPVRTRFIATLAAGAVAEDAGLWEHNWIQKPAFASADGSQLAFGSTAPLTGTPTAGLRQLFVYDDRAASLRCASCPSGGSAPTGFHVNSLTESDPLPRWNRNSGERRLIASDGTIYFDTTTPLVPSDQNSLRDVYEYRGGELRLVTTGSGTTHARLSGASSDGETVFFTTTESLVPQDDEPDIRKVYAARIGGGFSARTEDSEPCAEDACQGAPSAPPAPLPSPTTDLQSRNRAVPSGPVKSCASLTARANAAKRRALRARRAARNASGRTSKLRLTRRAVRLRRQAKRLNTRATTCRKSNRRAAR